MKASPEGIQLIQQYYQTAPKLVAIIENHSARSALLEFIYDKLVLVSITLIKQDRKKLAMEYYAAFTLALERLITP